MSISLSGAPYNFAPAYNPQVFYFQSTNIGQNGFRYLVNLYSASTSTLLGQFRVAPRPVDGVGYIDVSRIITNLLSYDFNGSGSDDVPAYNSYISYDVKIGEEYHTTWTYNDYEFQSSTGVTTNLVQLRQFASATTHTFIVGDQINVTSTNNVNGLHTVVAVPSPYAVIIDMDYFNVTPTGTIGGSIVYADNRKTQFSNLYNASGYTAFNGAQAFAQAGSFTDGIWSLTPTSPNYTKALTDLPVGGNQYNSFYCTPEQDLWVNYYNPSASTQSIKFVNSNGDIITQSLWTGSGQGKIRSVNVGPFNANPTTVVSGTSGIMKSDTEWIEFNTYSSSITATTSQTYRYYIDRRCQREDWQIAFLDRKGSFLSYAFNLNSKTTGTIKRDAYKQQVGQLTLGHYGYNTYDKGNTIYNVEVSKTIELQTNWMNDTMSVFFEQLLTCPVTYVRIAEDYFACTINDSSFEVKRQNNKNLIRQTISITLSNQDIINI